MICDPYKFIFIHIPKTGGTSVKNNIFLKTVLPGKRSKISFEDYCLSAHSSIKEYNIKFPERVSNYYKFSFVRNPWDKMLSYNFFCNKETDERLKSSFLPLIHVKGEFTKVVHHLYKNRDNEHIKRYVTGPQLEWFENENGKILMDDIFRFENLDEGIDRICKKLIIKRTPLEKLNTTNHEHYSHYYDDTTINMIGEMFKRDIDYFGYTFEKQ